MFIYKHGKGSERRGTGRARGGEGQWLAIECKEKDAMMKSYLAVCFFAKRAATADLAWESYSVKDTLGYILCSCSCAVAIFFTHHSDRHLTIHYMTMGR